MNREIAPPPGYYDRVERMEVGFEEYLLGSDDKSTIESVFELDALPEDIQCL